MIFAGLALAVLAALFVFIGFVGEDLTSGGWKLVAILGCFSLALVIGGLLLRREGGKRH